MIEALHEFYLVKISMGSMFLLSIITFVGGWVLGYLTGRET
jgi:hypothetical protein